jgi:putative transposase
VKDIFIACVDGLKGFPEAIETVFPKTQVQLCLVHLMRNPLAYVSYKDRKAVAGDLKSIYNSATAEEAADRLEEFCLHLGPALPADSSVVASELGEDHSDVWIP